MCVRFVSGTPQTSAAARISAGVASMRSVSRLRFIVVPFRPVVRLFGIIVQETAICIFMNLIACEGKQGKGNSRAAGCTYGRDMLHYAL